MKLRPYRPSDEGELVDAWFDSRRSVEVFHAEPRTTKEQLAERAPRTRRPPPSASPPPPP